MVDVHPIDTLGVYALLGIGVADTSSITVGISLIAMDDSLGTPSLYVMVMSSHVVCCSKNLWCGLCSHCDTIFNSDGTLKACVCHLLGQGPCIRFCDVATCHFALNDFINEIVPWI